MPSLEDIRQFNARLITLGDEPTVVQEWGEQVEDVEVPESAVDDDLASLLSDDDIESSPTDDLFGDSEAAADAGPAPDFEDLLSDDSSTAAETDELGSDVGLVDDTLAEDQSSDDLPDDAGFDLDDVGFALDDDAFAPADDAFAEPTGDDDFASAFTVDEPEVPGEDASGFDAEPDLSDGPDDEAVLPEDPFGGIDESFELTEPSEASEPVDDLDSGFDLADDAFEIDGDDLADDFATDLSAADDGPADLPADAGLDADFDVASFDAPDTTDESPAASDDFDLSDAGFDLDDDAFDANGTDEGFAIDDSTDDPFGSIDEAIDGAEADESPGTAETATEVDDFDTGFDLPDAGFDMSDTDFEASGGDDSADDGFGLPDEGFSIDDDELPSGELGADDFGGFDLSEPEPGTDSADTFGGDDFSFDAPSVPGDDDFSAPSFDTDTGASGDLGDVGDLDEIGAEDLDEFSLGDFGAEFGVLDDAGPSDEDLNPAIDIASADVSAPEIESAAPGSFSLTEEEFSRLQRGLAGLPLNLKQSVEQIVAEAKGTTDEVEKLCRMLVEGESATQIATYAGRILGTRIRIPRGYEKSSGEEFERERSSLAYQFRENIWPIVRLVGVFGIIATVVGLLGYNFIARPLIARSLYQQGVDLIYADQYAIGNQTFERAWDVWENPDWYYTYADAFADRRQYALAIDKYQELLFGRDAQLRQWALEALAERAFAPIYVSHDPPKAGILAYANLESEILGDYQSADRLVSLLLFSDTNDYEGRLAQGDNFMRWGDVDPSRFENARLSYARLIEQYGQTDELLFRMLGYFIAVDNLEQVLVLKETFQADSRARINPEVYGDLAGYLIDKQMSEDVEDVIFRALEVDDRIPELHYELARYYRLVNAAGSEELALGTAIRLLSDAEPFGPERRAKLIDAHTRVGENHYAAERILEAQESFTEAIDLYDQGRARRVLGPDPELARVYSHLGDLLYYEARDFQGALRQFDRAEENGFSSSDLDYKQGFVHYRNAELQDALDEFRQASDDPSAYTDALIWATANTYFRRSNYYAAEALYRELVDRVELSRARIRTLLLDEDSSHQSIVEYLFRGYNNLGVTLFELSEQTGDARRYSESLVFFTESTELAENYLRDPDTLARSQAVDLAFLNQREALFPRPEFEMQIYNEIPEDLDDPLF